MPRTCMAFINPYGTFRYICMPFGLSNAGSIYSQMLDLAMAYLPADYRLLYLDDILVYSMDTRVHLEKNSTSSCQGRNQDSTQGNKNIPSLNHIPRAHARLTMKGSRCWTNMYEIYRICHTQLAVERCPHFWDLQDILVTLTNWVNSMKKAENFEWLDDMEQDFKELKAEFAVREIQEHTQILTFHSHFGLVCIEYCWSTVTKLRWYRTFNRVLGRK